MSAAPNPPMPAFRDDGEGFKLAFELAGDRVAPFAVVIRGVYMPSGADPHELAALLAEGTDEARWSIKAPRATIHRLAALIDRAERHRTPRHVRRALEAKARAAMAELTMVLEPGWPNDKKEALDGSG